MSNLTSASNEASISSGNRVEVGGPYPQQPLASSQSNQTQQATAKKKRNLPGNPDPEAEVIALSPRSLLATNRFLCEICNKGFQREQNLQLHRRGHNLPWKLKQKTNKEVIRKKVYVCPETTCVHHDPSRALGDLTGVKKHFSRKHGEKKWKCEKCSKRYAVQSDWKAHSKICGTREYRCDCGTLFSRRDSFITHRAFCDALADESARTISSNPLNFLSSQSAGGSTSSTIQLHLQNPPHGRHGGGSLPTIFPLKREQDHHHNHLQQSFNLIRPPDMPPWLATGTDHSGPTTSHHDLFNPRATSSLDQSMTMSLHQENLNLNPNQELSSFAATAMTASPHMSATALLQKAAQMGVSMSPPCQSAETTTTTLIRPHQAHMMSTATRMMGSTSLATSSSFTTAGSSLGLSSREEMGTFIHPGLEASFGNKTVTTTGCMEQVAAGPSTSDQHGGLMGIMSSFASSSQIIQGFERSSTFGSSDNFAGIFLNAKRDNEISFQDSMPKPGGSSGSSKEGGVLGGRGRINDGLTRDFLGLKGFPHREFLNLDDLHRIGSSYEQQQQQQNQNPAPWQG